MTYRLEMYLLLIAGFILLPIYMSNRGSPLITRKKALKIASHEQRFFAQLLKSFWLIHLAISLLISTVVILIIENWNSNSSIGNVILLTLAGILFVLSGTLASLPSYVILKDWKRLNQSTH